MTPKGVLLSALLPCVFCCSGTPVPNPPSGSILPEEGKDEGKDQITVGPHKNVLLIMADDFNYWAGCVGYCDYSITPNINRLASKGVLFLNAFCSSPVSNPSRNALWSGFRPSTTGIDNNSKGYVRDRQGFENIVTMNQYFLEHGYYVLGAGKLYHPALMGGHETDPDHWSEMVTDGTGSQATGGLVDSWANPSWTTMTYKIGVNPSEEGNTGDLVVVNKVARMIEEYAESEHSGKPFFIGCGVFRPHLPWNVSSEFWNQYNPVEITRPRGYVEGDPQSMKKDAHAAVVEAGKWNDAIRAYLSCMTMTDKHVGILLEALEKTKYKDNTIILFMGDHGWHLGEKDNWGKNTVYNAANRTTFIMYDPSSEPGQHTCTAPVSLQDVYPTLVKMCNLPVNDFVEGDDISPLLQDPSRTDWNVPILSTYSGTNYIQDRHYKYIDAANDPKLFDLEHDPYETTNLYSAYYNTVAKVYKHKIDSILMIGNALKVRLGISPGSPSTDGISSHIPAGIFADCKGKVIVDRKAFQSVDMASNTIMLDLLRTDHVTEVALYDKSGRQLERKSMVGEMTFEYTSGVPMERVRYLRISDDQTVSVEEIRL